MDAPACESDAAIPVTTLDGGMNTACESCIGSMCGNEQCVCVTDSHTLPIDDAGTMAPGCDVFVNCVYADLTQILLTSDAGATAAVQQAVADCTGDGGNGFDPSSISAGGALISCIAANCGSACVP
jgi:hypothetical protein